MAIWPFSRRRKRSRKAAEDETGVTANHVQQPSQPNGPSSTLPGKAVRRDSKRRKRDAFDYQQQNDDVILSSIHPDLQYDYRRAVINNPNSQRKPSIDTSLPKNIVASRVRNNGTVSETNLGRGFSRPPTLRGSRPGSTEPHVLRHKSDKRKRNDRAREREIKNLSSTTNSSAPPDTFVPAAQWWAPIQPEDLARQPIGSTIDSQPPSGRTSPSVYESYAFKVSAFGALTPRPIIRYDESSRYVSPSSRGPSRTSASKDKKWVSPSDEPKRKNRVEELADDMDASALRELLERDTRRREIKRLKDQEKLQMKLQKRADRQREEERRRAARAGSPLDRRENAIENKSPDPPASWLRDPSKDSLVRGGNDSAKAARRLPTTDVETTASSSLQPREDATIYDPRASSSISPITTKQGDMSASQLTGTAYPSTSDVSRRFESEKQSLENGGKSNGSWTAFFRRGGSRLRRRQERAKESSEFSVPSRESFTRSPQPPAPGPAPPVPERSFKRAGASIKRSQSKFREHLNDFPLPPSNRNASPNVPATIEDTPETSNDTRFDAIATPDTRDCRYSSSRANSPEARPDSVLLTQSLASIDSEGSWLSGKPSRRISQAATNQRRGSAEEKLDESIEYAAEEGDNEIDTENNMPGPIRQDEEEGTWHAGVGKRPQLVCAESRTKSREVLINDFQMAGIETNNPDSPMDTESEHEVRRATSVDLGKGHARHISAGSAKLLDLPRRSSDLIRVSRSSTTGVEPPTTQEE